MVDPCQQTPGPANKTLIFHDMIVCKLIAKIRGKEIIKILSISNNNIKKDGLTDE